MLDDIIKKRTDLFNFFLNKDETFNKEEILHKEFAVLSFSPNEEYIDVIDSPFDNICVDLSTNYIEEDDGNLYIKGIIVDVDRQNYQTIIHLQNKEHIVSIVCRNGALDRYGDYFIVGEPIIAKCQVFNERLYLGFLIQLNDIDKFINEKKYIYGTSYDIIDSMIDESSDTAYGFILECSLVKTGKGRDMVRGVIYDGYSVRTFGSVKTSFNPKIPTKLVASDFVKFNKTTEKFFINNMEVVKL